LRATRIITYVLCVNVSGVRANQRSYFSRTLPKHVPDVHVRWPLAKVAARMQLPFVGLVCHVGGPLRATSHCASRYGRRYAVKYSGWTCNVFHVVRLPTPRCRSRCAYWARSRAGLAVPHDLCAIRCRIVIPLDAEVDKKYVLTDHERGVIR